MALSHVEILLIWEKCVGNDIEVDLLSSIVHEWIKLRGHSLACMEMEQYKKDKAQSVKKKGLWTELKVKNKE
jgi:hypothetical protein